MASIPLYLINLDRSPERLAHMRAQLGGLGLEFQRLRAVDGRNREGVGGLSPAETACFESHRLAWKTIAEGDAAFGVVLEDDGFAHPTFAKLVADDAWIPDDVEIVKLDTRWRRAHLGRAIPGPAGVEIRRLRSPAFGSLASIIRKETAAWMWEETREIGLTVDQYQYLPEGHPDRRLMSGRAPRVYQCVPATNIAAHRVDDLPELASLVSSERVDRMKRHDRRIKLPRWSVARLHKNIARPFRQLHKSVLFPTWTWLHGERFIRIPYADGRTARVIDGKKVRPSTDRPLEKRG